MSQDIERYIAEEARSVLKEEIVRAQGNEVFFIGLTDASKKIVAVKALARGNRSAVAASGASGELASQGNMVIHNHPGNDLTPSVEDVELSSFFATFSVGSLIIDNDVERIYVLVEPFEKKVQKKIDEEKVEHIFSNGGTINKLLPSYEFRPEQLQMAHQVSQGFNQETISLIEAGTGTGKTFAYLVPAIMYATLNKVRVVITTNTINLQEQLIFKDIPFLQKVFDVDFRATLVKGRGNYLCKRKLGAEEEQLLLFTDDDYKQDLENLNAWSTRTRDGSLSDLTFVPKDEVWEKVRSESESCLRIKCPFYNECFFYKARRNASASEILVINHHLLFADMALRIEANDFSESLLLPPFQSLIVDEAHNIEEAATSYFSRRLGRFTIQRVLKRLYALRRRGKESGFLSFLEHKLAKKETAVKERISELKQEVREKRKKIDDLFESFSEFFNIYFQNEGQKKPFITLTPDVLNTIEYKDIVNDNIVSLRFVLEDLLQSLKRLRKQLETCTYKKKKSAEGDKADLQSLCAKIMELVHIANTFLQEEMNDVVRWLECRARKGRGVELFFNIAPIDVKEVLRNTLFKRCKTVVLTSATLAVEGNLAYIKGRLGLPAQRTDEDTVMCSELILPSSFDYRHQVLLGIFEDIPAPTEAAFSEKLTKRIFKTLILSGGKAFVLFTSYSLLNYVASELSVPLSLSGITIMKQGEESRHKMLSRFRENISSVLFGTNSFWEGVDVEGESLSNVLITRLPFQVPNDPIIEARSERIKQRGGSPFLEYFVPEAVIKFKQGFGRLIRNRADFGTVLIFDSRVIHKNYGVKFLNSLPECTVVCGDEETVFSAVVSFYQSHCRHVNIKH